jgi:hypothetical protein
MCSIATTLVRLQYSVTVHAARRFLQDQISYLMDHEETRWRLEGKEPGWVPFQSRVVCHTNRFAIAVV